MFRIPEFHKVEMTFDEAASVSQTAAMVTCYQAWKV